MEPTVFEGRKHLFLHWAQLEDLSHYSSCPRRWLRLRSDSSDPKFPLIGP